MVPRGLKSAWGQYAHLDVKILKVWLQDLTSLFGTEQLVLLYHRQSLQQRGRSDLAKVGHQGNEVADANGIRIHRLSCFDGGPVRSGIPCPNVYETKTAKTTTATTTTAATTATT